MTFAIRPALIGIAAALVVAAAVVMSLASPPAERTHAQVAPATFYGTVDAGEKVEAFINDVFCTSATAGSDGF